MDADGDGTPDHYDNCGKPGTVLGWNDQADHDGDGIGDVCDDTPFPSEEMTPTWFTTAGDLLPVAALDTTTSRCKRQTFTQAYGLGFDFLRYSGTFRVCYTPGVRVVSWSEVYGDATYVLPPWDWHGNDPGYPHSVRLSEHAVQFTFRGEAAICVQLLLKGCGPSKHPWVRITFWDTNTITRSAGSV